jgi:ribosomal protein RSM22 (predicted rRNA methylase)
VNDRRTTTSVPDLQAEQMAPHVLNALADDILRLSKLLTRDRSELPAAYLNDAALRKAYHTYFLPANRAKVRRALDELSLHPRKVLRKDRLRVLDLGSGPGTAVLGVLDFFSQHDHRPVLEFTAQDQVAENLKEAMRLFADQQHGYAAASTLTTIHSTIDKVEVRLEGRYDIIVLSNLLNELYARDAAKCSRRTVLLDRKSVV